MQLDDKTKLTVIREGGGDDYVIWDDSLPGFGVRVRASGQRSWHVQYKRLDGKTRRKAIADIGVTYAVARKQAERMLVDAKHGKDPVAEITEKKNTAKAERDATFASILPTYLAERERDMRPNGFDSVKRHLDRHGKPLHDKSYKTLTLAEASAFLRGIAETAGLVQRNRVRASFRKLYRWLQGEGLTEINPFAFTNRTAEKARERTPPIEELVEIWHAATAYGELGPREWDYSTLIKLQMLTGCRRNEIAKLSSAELTPDRIRLPGARTKNKCPHDIPRTAAMDALLSAIPLRKITDNADHQKALNALIRASVSRVIQTPSRWSTGGRMTSAARWAPSCAISSTPAARLPRFASTTSRASKLASRVSTTPRPT